MNDLQQFKNDLGQELVDAARRNNQQQTSPTTGLRAHPVAVISFAAVVLVAALVGLPRLNSLQTAEADNLSIAYLEDRLEIRVSDIVDHPDELTAKLQDEFGIKVQLIPVPVDPRLIGTVSSFGTPGMVEASAETNSEGLVQTIILPAGFAGILIVDYGVPAGPGEIYNSTLTDERCRQLYGQTIGESLSRVLKLGSSVRFDTYDADYSSRLDIDHQTIPANYRLSDVFPLSDNSYIVTYAEDLEKEPRHPNCI